MADPGPQSDFSQWVYTSQYNTVAVAAASLGAEVSLFWIKSDRSIYQMKSTDYGASWDSPTLIDYSPTTASYGLAASYQPNGDIGLFFADQATLYVKKRMNGSWQTKAGWDKTTGDLSGVAADYDGDFNLTVTGRDSSGNFKLWSLIHGDGSQVPVGTWSELKEIAQAPTDGNFEYRQAFMSRLDVYRCCFVEKFTGAEAYARPFWMRTVADTDFEDNLWCEPVPFNLSSEYGLAIAHHGDYGWLSSPSGVWRASLAEESLDLSADILSVRQELGKEEGKLTIELDNSHGRYISPGTGEIETLAIGNWLEFSPGYVTAQGSEFSSGPVFRITGYEHITSGGKAGLNLEATDGWELIKSWRARQQFRWNKSGDEMSVRDILAFTLGRCGLKLEVKSASAALDGYCPDFAIPPGSQGHTVIRRLLSFVPDLIFPEGAKAYALNPSPTDGSVYAYGQDHPIKQGSYRREAWEYNRIQVEGYDPVAETPVIVDSFGWDEVDRLGDRLKRIEDTNLTSAAQAGQRGQAHLREAEITARRGEIRIPPNCGQQLYDVIDITDPGAGLEGEKMRIVRLVLGYHPLRAEYEAQLLLGAV